MFEKQKTGVYSKLRTLIVRTSCIQSVIQTLMLCSTGCLENFGINPISFDDLHKILCH